MNTSSMSKEFLSESYKIQICVWELFCLIARASFPFLSHQLQITSMKSIYRFSKLKFFTRKNQFQLSNTIQLSASYEGNTEICQPWVKDGFFLTAGKATSLWLTNWCSPNCFPLHYTFIYDWVVHWIVSLVGQWSIKQATFSYYFHIVKKRV